MPYSYIEHIADIGITAQGMTIEEAFEQGVEAMLGLMFVLEGIKETRGVHITAKARETDLLFVEVLNEVLSVQGRDNLALRRLKADGIRGDGRHFTFSGTAYGEPLDLERHEVKTEVKGATYAGLRYSRRLDGGHVLSCVLDV